MITYTVTIALGDIELSCPAMTLTGQFDASGPGARGDLLREIFVAAQRVAEEFEEQGLLTN